MTQPALQPGFVAVITGGAAGIAFAAALRIARLCLRSPASSTRVVAAACALR